MLLYNCAPKTESELNEGFGRHVEWVRRCVPMMTRGRQDAENTTERCITHLTSRQLPAAAGKFPETVGRWLRRAMETDEGGAFDQKARQHLMTFGMRVANLRETGKGAWGYRDADYTDQIYVLIAPKTHSGMAQLFERSKWADGGWTQALEGASVTKRGDAEPIVPIKSIKTYFGGNRQYALAVPIEALLGDDWRRGE